MASKVLTKSSTNRLITKLNSKINERKKLTEKINKIDKEIIKNELLTKDKQKEYLLSEILFTINEEEKLVKKTILLEKEINEDSYTAPKPNIEFKKEFQKARLLKKKSQADVAKSLNIKQNIINEYESGKKVPDNLTIAKLERLLGVKLPRNKKIKITD